MSGGFRAFTAKAFPTKDARVHEGKSDSFADCFVVRETSPKLKRAAPKIPGPSAWLRAGSSKTAKTRAASVGRCRQERVCLVASGDCSHQIASSRLLGQSHSARSPATSLRYVVVDGVWWSAFFVALARAALGRCAAWGLRRGFAGL